MSDGFTHFDGEGRAHMVDVGSKPSSERTAVASGRILMHGDTLRMVVEGSHRKGDVLGVARIAGIAGAKRTADLVPLCHPLPLSHVAIEFVTEAEENAITCRATAKTVGQTGVEMEALCAVQTALLTIYDMCKAVDRGMTIDRVRLDEKRGGRSGHWQRETAPKP